MPGPALKSGEAADPFGNTTKGKDQSRVPLGNPNTPVLADKLGDEAVRHRRNAMQAMNATTRLGDIKP